MPRYESEAEQWRNANVIQQVPIPSKTGGGGGATGPTGPTGATGPAGSAVLDDVLLWMGVYEA